MSKLLLASAGLALALAAQPLQAQFDKFDIRLGAQTVEPTGDLDDSFNYGYGAYARVGMLAAPWSLMGAVTWTRFIANGSLVSDADEFTLQVGPHIGLREGFDLGVEAAYLTDTGEFGIVPVLSIGLVNIEATFSYTTTFSNPMASWFALGVGLKF